MDHRSRRWVRRRLRSLLWLELLNIPLQAAAWFGVVGLPVTAPNAVGFALFAVLLVMGAGYWAAKLRQMARPGAGLAGAGAFAVARRANPLVLAAGLLYVGAAVAADPGAGSLPGLAFALFAVLEHVNYFHVQLMYDTVEDLRHLFGNGLRRAHLARDLEIHARRRRWEARAERGG